MTMYDDYFTIGPLLLNVCVSCLKVIGQAATKIGIPLSPDKCVGPMTCLIFLGIELDSVRMTAKLPADKCTELIEVLKKIGE